MNLTPINELDSPPVADTIDSDAAIGAATEPMVRPNTVEDRTLDPATREHAEGYVPPVKPHRRFHKAFCSVGDQIVELDAGRHRPRVDAAGYRPNEAEVSSDTVVPGGPISVVGRKAGRLNTEVGGRDAIHVLQSFDPSQRE